MKVVDADSKPFIDHLVVDVGFLRDHALDRVVELLENQGWDKLYLGNCTLNKELARQFFSTLTISDEDSSLLGQFSINGSPNQFTHSEIGMILNVPMQGFSDYIKNQWPSTYDKEGSISRVIGQVPTASSSSSTGHEGMDLTTKVMFMYTICNLVTRKEGRDKVAIEDYLLLNKIFDLKQVSLNKNVMKHLEHARSV